jgi:hypothetical protein
MMRAPDQPPDSAVPRFSAVFIDDDDPAWTKIKNSFAAVDVDADIVTADPGIGIGKFPHPWPLREALPYLAEAAAIAVAVQRIPPTPSAVAAEQRRTIKRCHDLLARLGDDDARHNRFDPETHWLQFPWLPRSERHARAAVLELVADLERAQRALAAMPTSRGSHLRAMHVQFWTALERIWRDNVRTKSTAKHLADFLFACSQPFFPDDTTHTAISAFVERLPDSSK